MFAFVSLFNEEPTTISVVDLIKRSPIITEPINTNAKEWRDFQAVFQELLKTRHPSNALLEELRMRRAALRLHLMPMVNRLYLRHEFEGENLSFDEMVG